MTTGTLYRMHGESGNQIVNLVRRAKSEVGERKLTKQSIADKLGIELSAVSQWFSGKTSPNQDNLKGLAKLLETTEEDLISSSDIPTVNINSPNNTVNVSPSYNNFYITNIIVPSNLEEFDKIIKGLIATNQVTISQMKPFDPSSS